MKQILLGAVLSGLIGASLTLVFLVERKNDNHNEACAAKGGESVHTSTNELICVKLERL